MQLLECPFPFKAKPRALKAVYIKCLLIKECSQTLFKKRRGLNIRMLEGTELCNWLCISANHVADFFSARLQPRQTTHTVTMK